MDPIVHAALVGTANAQGPHLTGTPVDALVEPAAADETRFLLAAGAASVYIQAGRKPGQAAELPGPAPEDPRPACGPAVAAVLRELLSGEHRVLLPEACSRMAAAGLRLPFELLPAALSVPAPFRSAIRQILGERGRWLARFNDSWTWARTQGLEAAPDAPEDALPPPPPDAERIWEEGNLEDRMSVLRRVRAVDPALARSWLAPVLSKEKAEPRARLLSTLETGLGPDDEELLEKSLDDRSSQVRSTAGLLLARLPGSACARRLRERADAMLSVEEAKPAAGFFGRVAALVSGGGAELRLTVEPPMEIDRSWERDGLPSNPPQGVGKRAFWLVHALSRVPPAHWVERFGHGPAELLAAAARSSEWGVVEGWTQATVRFGAADWAAPLWDFGRGKSAPAEMKELLPDLVDVMPPAEREPRIEALLASSKEDESLARYLEQVPIPWSPGFAGQYLERTRRLVAEVARGGRQHYNDPWLATLPVAALALPPASFGTILGEWALDRVESPTWIQSTWTERLQVLRERVRLRMTLHKEILP